MEQNRLRGKLRALIPQHVSSRTVLGFFEFLRRAQKLSPCRFAGNFARNERAMARHTAAMRKNGGFVEDQPAWGDLAYGRSDMRAAGCEIFAVYNTLLQLGNTDSGLPELIRCFEKDGMVLSGRFGTAPIALADHLRKLGYRVELSTNPAAFDSLSRTSGCLILTMYNDRRNILDAVHTVSITPGPDGFTAHNVRGDGRPAGPFPDIASLLAGINGGRAGAIAMMGVNRS